MLERLILWFLRMFAHFRNLEERNRDLETKIREAADARVRAEDEGVYWRQHSDELEERLEESHKREIDVREMMADFISEQRWGIKIFNKAPSLPPESISPEPIPGRRVQARFLVKQKTRERLRQLVNEANK